jgi:hypothetical protein
VDVKQKSVIFHYRLKGHGYKRIQTKLVATYGRSAYTEDSVKFWIGGHDRGRRDPAKLCRIVTPPSDIAEAVSKVLSEQPFSLTKSLQPSSEGVADW